MPHGKLGGISRPLADCNLGVKIELGASAPFPSNKDQLALQEGLKDVVKSDLKFVTGLGAESKNQPSLEFSDEVDWSITVIVKTDQSELLEDSITGISGDIGRIKNRVRMHLSGLGVELTGEDSSSVIAL